MIYFNLKNWENWVNLNFFYYIGKSKKHQIFRAKKWNKSLEKILKKPIFNEKYEIQGKVKDIFGPINSPFISIKILPNIEFNPHNKFFAKMH